MSVRKTAAKLLLEREAADRAAIGAGITRMLADAARR